MRAFCRAFLLILLLPLAAAAQPDDESTPAFTLSSSEVFTTRDNPSFHLTFRRMPQLDFRVYRVRDPFKFFAGLRDPHQLGSEDRPVAQERSWIERIADWKARQRRELRSFFRGQVSQQYRVQRRAAEDKQEIAQRVVLNQASFAQVPLLNPDQLVSAWRELLPNHRDTEMRRVPLDVKQQPGVYLVEAVSGLLRAYTIVIVSDVGLVTKVAPGQMVVFAADRFSGEPKASCDVQVVANGAAIASGQSNTDGIVAMNLPPDKLEDLVGVARCGDQMAATDPGAWFSSEPAAQLVGYIYTDKPIYRPGHTVHVKAILRWRERDALRPFDKPSVELATVDTNDKVIARQPLTVDAFGAVSATLQVPATAALGMYSLRIVSGEQQAYGSFEVQEYRRPEFEVILTPANRFVVQGNEAVIAAQARYYFGQPVANGRLRYSVNQQAYYSPLRWSDAGDGEEGGQYWYGDEQRVQGELRLDAQGRGEIRVPLAEDENGRDFSARIQAAVMDASGREVTGSTIVHATYGPSLLTSQLSGYLFRAGQPVQITLRAIDYIGQPQPGMAVRVALERITYSQGYYGDRQITQVAETSSTTAADGTASAQFTVPAEAGSYRIVASATHGDREIKTESWFWVPGPQEVAESDEERYLELIADKRAYAPGDVARFVVRGEPVSGPMLVTKEGQHVTWHRLLRPTAGEAIEVPIETGDVGDIYVHIAFMRDGRLYRAERRAAVPATDRVLQMTLTADRPVAKPQDPGVFTLNVTDAAGKPVRAQVSLGVIDEAVYAIRPDDTPDPVRYFYRREYSRVSTTFSRDYYFTGFSGSERLQLASRRRRPFTLADFKGDKQVQPQVRKDFPDAIYWISDLVTDAAGQAKVSIKYPDALTTWRLTARAVTAETLVGSTVARTTTTKDLIVRIVTPRFLTQGDRVVLPTITHNYREDAKDTAVSFKAVHLLPEDAASASVTPLTSSIAAGGERRDEWRFNAMAPGTATVTALATTETDKDAVELSIPILPYGLRRDAGTSGSIRDAAEHTAEVTVPSTANPEARTVTVALAPSLAGSLVGALDFLTSFPYGCTEQTLSSFLPNVLVTRTLTQLKLAPTERLSVLDRQVSEGLRRLIDFQHEDGGWGWWKTDQNHPFMTAYALYGLTEAQRAGYRIDTYRLERGGRALAAMYTEYPRAEPDLKAYMAYVLRRVAPDPKVLDDVWQTRDRMSPYGRALLLLTLDEASDPRGNELAPQLLNEAQTRGDLSWWASDRDQLLFDYADTSVEATAFAVQALSRRDPGNALLERGVRYLMANRRGGYWASTKQTAMVLYGLLGFLEARKETPQPFEVEVHVNGTLAGTHRFTAASFTDPDPIKIVAPARGGANTVRVVKKGTGTLYWSASANFYDTEAAQSRTGGRELAISRRYARLAPVKRRDGTIVYQEQAFDGQMNPGDVLSIRITVAGSREWRYLMIEDPLPAGVEAIADTTAYPMERQDRWRWWWGSQVEYRDNRTVFFQEEFGEGRYEFIYLVKATAPGEFRAMPAQVTPMYVPDVAASSEAQTVRVATPSGGSR